MPSLATKIERIEDIVQAIGRLEAQAISAQVPSVIRALNEAKNTSGYALAQLVAELKRCPNQADGHEFP